MESAVDLGAPATSVAVPNLNPDHPTLWSRRGRPKLPDRWRITCYSIMPVQSSY